MAHFYGRLIGNRGEATRCGSKDSGIRVTAESWHSVLMARQFHRNGRDRLDIDFTTKHGGHLFRATFNAEGAARHRGDAGVERALREVGEAFQILDDAVQAADKEALGVTEEAA